MRPFSLLRRVFGNPACGLIMLAQLIAPSQVHAWANAPSTYTTQTLGTCTLEGGMTGYFAEIYVSFGAGAFDILGHAGGTYYSFYPYASTYGNIDATELESSCGLSGVNVVSQTGANAPGIYYANSTTMEATIQATQDSDGKTYDWVATISGGNSDVPSLLVNKTEVTAGSS